MREGAMICENCGKHYGTKDAAHVIDHGRPQAVTFCSYKCYIEFWSGCKNFEPLPEYIKELQTNTTEEKK